MAPSRRTVWIALSVSVALHLFVLLIPHGRDDIPTQQRFHLSPVRSASLIELLRAGRPELIFEGMERLPGPAFVLPGLSLTEVPSTMTCPDPLDPS